MSEIKQRDLAPSFRSAASSVSLVIPKRGFIALGICFLACTPKDGQETLILPLI
jgi:hypothetical protein